MDGGGDNDEKHVQVSFFTNETSIKLPLTAFDVPITTEYDNLNQLVNATIKASDDLWKDRRFEFLISDTFLRSNLEDFIEEYNVETECVIKIECVLGVDAPKPKFDLPAPDWISSVHTLDHHFVASSYGGDILVWDAAAGKKMLESKNDSKAYKCCKVLAPTKSAKSLNGLRVVVGGEAQTLNVMEYDGTDFTTQIVFRGHERSVECVAVNSDGTRLISGAFDSHLKVWNLEDDDTTTVFDKASDSAERSKKKKENYVTKTPMVTLGGHKDAVVDVAWAPWSAGQAISVSWDHSLVVWDLELAGEVNRLRTQKTFNSVDVNPRNNMVLATSSDAFPRLYDPRSNDGALVKQSFTGHIGWVSDARWSPDDDNTFVSASYDKGVKMWDVRSAKTSLFDLHGHEDRVLCVTYGKKHILSGGVDATMKVYLR